MLDATVDAIMHRAGILALATKWRIAAEDGDHTTRQAIIRLADRRGYLDELVTVILDATVGGE